MPLRGEGRSNMEYKGIPGFETKFEIGEDGIVRNIKTKRETKPYHTSEKTGPMVHLLDTKADKEARLSVIRLVDELFGRRYLAGTWIPRRSRLSRRSSVSRGSRIPSELLAKSPRRTLA